jgi:hypothetical protein
MDWNSEKAEKAEGHGQQHTRCGTELQQSVGHAPQPRFIFIAPRPYASLGPFGEPLGK